MQPAPFETVLCPVDFSDVSGHALRYAARLAAGCRAKLIALHATWFDVPPYFTEGRVAELAQEFRDSRFAAERSLAAFVNAALGEEAAAAVEMRMEEARPADAILAVAADMSAGLIVMGTHGRGGHRRWMLGSVAERVLRESPVPLVTVRGPREGGIRRILCPVSGSDLSRQALGLAAALAGCLGAELTVAHVREPEATAAPPDLCAWMPAEDRARCRVREVERHGDAAVAIAGLAAEEPFDLLVMGASRRTFFDGLIPGTTTLRAVQQAPCPVLAVGERSN